MVVSKTATIESINPATREVIGEVPIMGLPGCVMHDPYTSFNVLLPRILAGDNISRADIVGMGYGGLNSC